MSRPKRGTRQNRTPVLHGLPTPNAGMRRTARRAVEKIEKEILQKRLTDEKAILKELENQYMTAIEAINWRIGNLLWRKDADLPNVIHQVQYQRAIKAQIQAALDRLHAGEYESIQQYLKDSYTDGYVGAMYTLHESGAPVIAPIDQDAAIRAITIESKLREPLYESLGVDLRKLKTSIASEITRGISMGQSYDRIARNISLLTKAPLSRAKTIVRTEAGRVQEQAAYAAGQKAIAAGANVVKQWSAVLDGKTREDHRRLDHQVREMGEDFEVNGQKAQYPHGFDDPKQDCNCRCTLLVISRSMMDAGELKRMQERAEFFGLDKTKDFEEFREKYLKAVESVENAGKSGIINMDLTNHATERMTQREVADVDVEDAKKNPLYTKPVVVDAQGRKSQIIIGKKATICINPESGRIITTWKTSSRLRRKYGGGD